MVSLSQFGLFGPRCLLNDADAKCACISVHIPLHHILLFVPIYHTSILSPFTVRVFPLMLTPHSPPFLFGCVSDQGFVLPPSSLACFCPRGTCCCILLRRIAEFSCLLNLLNDAQLFHFCSLLSHLHTSTLHSHSFSSFTFVSFLLGLSFSTQRVYACNSTSRTTRVIHCSTVSVYPDTFTLSTNRR